MRTFLVVWLGQFVSLLGSEMTNFAITIWAWEASGQVTHLSTLLAISQISRLLISPIAGLLVDKYNRKFLMLSGDSVAGLSTLILLILLLGNNLQIWHLYVSTAVNALFGQVQELAHTSSITLLVDRQHYGRAAALESLQASGSYTIAPAVAGTLYAIAGLKGVLTVDVVTFTVAIATLSFVAIPQPKITSDINNRASESLNAFKGLFQQLAFGLRYTWSHPGLAYLLGFLLINNFIDSGIFAILPAMVLARSGGDTVVWGTLLATFGFGGLLGGVTLSLWGGPKRRIHGVLLASALWKLGLTVLALARRTSTKVGVACFSGLCSPFPFSCNRAIWQSKVEPELQGRVFSTQYVLSQLSAPFGTALAGPLADRLLEPAMQQGRPLGQLLGSIFGTNSGAGMAVLVTLLSLCGVFVALGGYGIQSLRQIEN